MATKTYDPNSIAVVVNGILMSGFSENSIVKVSRNQDMWSDQIGADGTGTRSKSNDKSGKIEISLMQTSASNDVLSALAVLDEATNGGKVPVLIKDLSGTSLHGSEEAWIVKIPDSDYGNKAGTRSWVIATHSLSNFVGGNS